MDLIKKRIREYLKKELNKEYITDIDYWYSEYYKCYNVEYSAMDPDNKQYRDLYRLTTEEFNALKKGL